MGLISPPQVTDGSMMKASDVNNPVNTIANEFNGNIDNANIKAAAAIATSKIAVDGGLGGGSLAGTYKVTRQNDTSNVTEQTARILTGYGYIANTAVSSLAKAVTFNSAFTSPPIVFAVCGGDNSTLNTYGSGGINLAGGVILEAHSVTAAGFTVYMKKQDGTNFSTPGNTFYLWIAIGI